jgi:hypothetical protein
MVRAGLEDLLRPQVAEAAARDLDVAVKAGSLVIETEPATDLALMRDLLSLCAGDILDGLASKRSQVLERWQKLAKSTAGLWFEISLAFLPRPIVVSVE